MIRFPTLPSLGDTLRALPKEVRRLAAEPLDDNEPRGARGLAEALGQRLSSLIFDVSPLELELRSNDLPDGPETSSREVTS